MMSADITPPDRRNSDRRRQQLQDARQKRWKNSTPESRRAFAKKLSEAAKAARAQNTVKKLKVTVDVDPGEYDWYIRQAFKKRMPVRAILRHALHMFYAQRDRLS